MECSLVTPPPIATVVEELLATNSTSSLTEMLTVVEPATLQHVRAELATRIVKLATVLAFLASVEPVVVVTTDKSDRKLTVFETAQRLGVNKGWLYKNWKSIPGAVKLSHRQLRFSERGLERYQKMRQAA